MSKIVTSLTPSDLSEWLSLIERGGDQFDVSAVPTMRVAAAYISVEKSKRPNMICDSMSRQEWGKYLDEEAVLFFLEKASTALRDFDIFKKKKFTLYT
jgi:hypothetical protein